MPGSSSTASPTTCSVADPAGRVSLRDSRPDDAEQRALRVAWSRQQAAQAMLTRDADLTHDRTGPRARPPGPGGARACAAAAGRRAGRDRGARRRGHPGGPDPAQRSRPAAGGAPAGRQRLLPQWTAASYPGYGYGWYPGYGYGFFGYGGSFVTGLLAGELLPTPSRPGAATAASAWSGYDVGYGQGYDQGYGSGLDAGAQGDQGDFVSGDPGYVTDSSYDPAQGDAYSGGDFVSGDPGYVGDAGGFDSGGFDGGFDSGGFDGGGGSDN